MKRVLSFLLAALLAGCGVSPSGPVSSLQSNSTTPPTAPQIAQRGTTDIFGLRLAINGQKWRQLEAGPYKLDAELVDKRCDVPCWQVVISTQDSDPANHGVEDEYYRLRVTNGEFITETECSAGASAFDRAVEQPSTLIGGEKARVYISGPCDTFTQGPPGPRKRHLFTWFIPSKRYLIQLVEAPAGPTYGEVNFPKALEEAQWS